jgi:hypothetical protein
MLQAGGNGDPSLRLNNGCAQDDSSLQKSKHGFDAIENLAFTAIRFSE